MKVALQSSTFVIDSDIVDATLRVIPDIMCLLSTSSVRVEDHPMWIQESLRVAFRQDLWQSDCFNIMYLPALSIVVINGIIHEIPEEKLSLKREFYVNKQYLPNSTILVVKTDNKLEITLNYQDNQKAFSTIKKAVCLL